MHKMSDIVTALLRSGLELDEFEEYPFDLDGTPDPDVEGNFPFSYLIMAHKK